LVHPLAAREWPLLRAATLLVNRARSNLLHQSTDPPEVRKLAAHQKTWRTLSMCETVRSRHAMTYAAATCPKNGTQPVI